MEFFDPHRRHNHSRLNNSVSKRMFLYQYYWYKCICNKQPIILTPSLTMSWGQVEKNNWGDDINVFFLKDIAKSPIVFTPIHASWADNIEVYTAIGSVIQWAHNPQTIIWGSGLIDDNSEPYVLPKKILAIRGPLTRKRLIDKGIPCPEIYGDPALLIPYYYMPNLNKKYKLGIIPHVSNYYKRVLDKYRNNQEISIIKLFDYKNWKDVVNAILECDFIVSSSLHGLIAAESYGIPNAWVEFEEPIAGKLGNRFKFHDFFLSQGFDITEPFVVTEKVSSEDLLQVVRNQYVEGRRTYSIKPLVETCPFNLKKPLTQFK